MSAAVRGPVGGGGRPPSKSGASSRTAAVRTKPPESRVKMPDSHSSEGAPGQKTPEGAKAGLSAVGEASQGAKVDGEHWVSNSGGGNDSLSSNGGGDTGNAGAIEDSSAGSGNGAVVELKGTAVEPKPVTPNGPARGGRGAGGSGGRCPTKPGQPSSKPAAASARAKPDSNSALARVKTPSSSDRGEGALEDGSTSGRNSSRAAVDPKSMGLPSAADPSKASGSAPSGGGSGTKSGPAPIIGKPSGEGAKKRSKPATARRGGNKEEGVKREDPLEVLIDSMKGMLLFADSAPELLRAVAKATVELSISAGDTVIAQGTLGKEGVKGSLPHPYHTRKVLLPTTQHLLHTTYFLLVAPTPCYLTTYALLPPPHYLLPTSLLCEDWHVQRDHELDG